MWPKEFLIKEIPCLPFFQVDFFQRINRLLLWNGVQIHGCADSHPAGERPEPAFAAAPFPQLAPVQLRLTASCGALQTPIREDDCWQGFKTCLQNPIYSISRYVFFCKVPNGPPLVDRFVKIHAICLLWQAQKFHRLFFWFYEFNQSGKNFVEYCFSI